MSATDDRRGELIAAAATGELTAAETEELDVLRAGDPTVELEIEELRHTVAMLGTHAPTGPWIETEPSEALRERVLSGASTPTLGRSPHRTRSRRTAALVAAAAIAGVVVGGGLGWGIHAGTSGATSGPEQEWVAGPPGTLGAYEQIDFTAVASGSDVEGGLVAHTWGTETVLEMDGVPDEGIYEVILVERTGDELASGTFLGSEVTIECRMNAAVLRQDVTDIEIRNSGGTVLARAQLPTAS